MEAFDRAIEDTITALNTGCLRARDGAVLQQSKGKAYLSNSVWREKLDAVVDLLRAIRSRYDLARNDGMSALMTAIASGIASTTSALLSGWTRGT
jgi:hypothetical protein